MNTLITGLSACLATTAMVFIEPATACALFGAFFALAMLQALARRFTFTTGERVLDHLTP